MGVSDSHWLSQCHLTQLASCYAIESPRQSLLPWHAKCWPGPRTACMHAWMWYDDAHTRWCFDVARWLIIAQRMPWAGTAHERAHGKVQVRERAAVQTTMHATVPSWQRAYSVHGLLCRALNAVRYLMVSYKYILYVGLLRGRPHRGSLCRRQAAGSRQGQRCGHHCHTHTMHACMHTAPGSYQVS